MSKLADQLRAIGICNPHELVEDGHPLLAYYRETGRLNVFPSHWSLWVKGKRFTAAAWYEAGALWFSGNVRDAIVKALAKCRELFPELEMVKGPWPNTYVPRVDLDKAKERIKEQPNGSKEKDAQ